MADSPAGWIRYRRAVNSIERQFERLRTYRPLLVDAVVAAVCAALSLATVFTQKVADGYHEPSAWTLATMLICIAPVVVRRRYPLSALLVSCVGIFMHLAFSFPEGSLPAVTLLLTYSVAASTTLRRSVIGLAAVWATLLGLAVIDVPGLDALGVFNNIAIFAIAWLIGVVLRGRRHTLESRVRVAEERALLEQQQAARVLAEERLRIAQELHDVLAHNISMINVQAGVGLHLMDNRPEQAREALAAIKTASSEALREVRAVLGVLRPEEEAAPRQPALGLDRLTDLTADAGLPVTTQTIGERRDLPAEVDRAAYRIVQEALTNVRRHAPPGAAATVTVEYAPDKLRLAIRNAGPSPPQQPETTPGPSAGGSGIAGMRARAASLGGILEAGTLPDGGYLVAVTLPTISHPPRTPG